MDHDLREAAERVDAMLAEARELAMDRLEVPSDDAVMQIFGRLCLEYDAAVEARLDGDSVATDYRTVH